MAKRTSHSTRVRKGDLVRVIAGEDRGRDGRVLRVNRDKGQVVVEGVNLVHRHIRRSQKHPQGGRLRRESPIAISNVMMLDPEKNEATRVGRKQTDESRGSLGWSRISKKSGKPLDEAAGKPAKKSRKKKE